MALAFNKAKGSAKKGGFDSYAYKVGDNQVRLIGDILPRYVYWLEGPNDKRFPMECLAFNRNTEAFDNNEKDYIQEYYPDLKCSWSYSILCIDLSDDRIKVLNLKRKLLEQLMITAEDLGDPTDPDTGWTVCFKKVKTGSHAFNVEYQLQPLKCKPAPLTEEQKAKVASHEPIDKIIPRPTAEDQRKKLEAMMNNTEGADNVDQEIEDEFDL